MVTTVTIFFASVVSRYARQQLFFYIWLPPTTRADLRPMVLHTRVCGSRTSPN
jgi:hypothetical protein